MKTKIKKESKIYIKQNDRDYNWLNQVYIWLSYIRLFIVVMFFQAKLIFHGFN